MKYKHIVFDVDGTLIDTKYAILHSLQDTLQTITGETFALSDLDFALGITGQKALQQLNIKNIENAISLWEKNMHIYDSNNRIFEGIEQLLQKLAHLDFNLGIVTSETREEFHTTFKNFSLQNYFQTIICADDTLKHKPNPDPLLKYIKKANCSNNAILYIGDSIYDKECAQKSGIDFALACWGTTRDFPCTLTFQSPNDVLNYLSSFT